MRSMISRRGKLSGSSLSSPQVCAWVYPLQPQAFSSHHDQPMHPTSDVTSSQKLLEVSRGSTLISSSFLSHARPDLVMEESIIPLSPSQPPCKTVSSRSSASHQLDYDRPFLVTPIPAGQCPGVGGAGPGPGPEAEAGRLNDASQTCLLFPPMTKFWWSFNC